MTVAAPTATAQARTRAGGTSRQSLLFAVATGAALALALRAPLLVTVFGLVTFGVLHNALELRYVVGRFAGVLRGPLLYTLVALISGIVLCRLAAARTPEILLGYAVLGVGVWWAPRVLWQRVAGFAVLGAALAVSLGWPAYHFVVLAHLHNVVPLFFLWEWAGRLPARARRGFRATQVGWVLAVPALIFSGLLDRWFAAGGGAVGVGALLALLFVGDYAQGRLVYSSFASYHAYLEFPVVLALLLGTPAARPARQPATPD
jgi:hypothetical protein